MNATSSDFEDGFVVTGMLATSLALLLSLMTSALFAVSLKRVRRLLKVATVWRVIISLTWAVQFLVFMSLASTLAMLVVGSGGPRTSVKDRRCDRAAKSSAFLSARVQGDRVVEDLLSVHTSDKLPPEPGPNEVSLSGWTGTDARSLLVALSGHYVTGLVSRDGE